MSTETSSHASVWEATIQLLRKSALSQKPNISPYMCSGTEMPGNRFNNSVLAMFSVVGSKEREGPSEFLSYKQSKRVSYGQGGTDCVLRI